VISVAWTTYYHTICTHEGLCSLWLINRDLPDVFWTTSLVPVFPFSHKQIGAVVHSFRTQSPMTSCRSGPMTLVWATSDPTIPYHPRLQAELDFSYWFQSPCRSKKGFLVSFRMPFSSEIHFSFKTCPCRRKRICLQLFICDDICKLVFNVGRINKGSFFVSLRYPFAFFIAIGFIVLFLNSGWNSSIQTVINSIHRIFIDGLHIFTNTFRIILLFRRFTHLNLLGFKSGFYKSRLNRRCIFHSAFCFHLSVFIIESTFIFGSFFALVWGMYGRFLLVLMAICLCLRMVDVCNMLESMVKKICTFISFCYAFCSCLCYGGYIFCDCDFFFQLIAMVIWLLWPQFFHMAATIITIPIKKRSTGKWQSRWIKINFLRSHSQICEWYHPHWRCKRQW